MSLTCMYLERGERVQDKGDIWFLATKSRIASKRLRCGTVSFVSKLLSLQCIRYR